MKLRLPVALSFAALAACGVDNPTPNPNQDTVIDDAPAPSVPVSEWTLLDSVTTRDGVRIDVLAHSQHVVQWPVFYGELFLARAHAPDIDGFELGEDASWRLAPLGLRTEAPIRLVLDGVGADENFAVLTSATGTWTRLPLFPVGDRLVTETTWTGDLAFGLASETAAFDDATAHPGWGVADPDDPWLAAELDPGASDDPLAFDKALNVRFLVKSEVSGTLCGVVDGEGAAFPIPLFSPGVYLEYVDVAAIPGTLRFRIFESVNTDCSTEDSAVWPSADFRISVAGEYGTANHCVNDGTSDWLEAAIASRWDATYTGTEACPDATSTIPTSVQFRLQRYTPSAGEEVCLAVDGLGTFHVPFDGTKYAAYATLDVPGPTTFWWFRSSSSLCADDLGLIGLDDGLVLVDSAYVDGDVCVARPGDAEQLAYSVVVEGGRVLTANGSACDGGEVEGTPLQFRVQNLSIPLTGTEAVCVTIDGVGTSHLPLSGSKYSAFISVPVPQDHTFWFFVGTDSSCSAEARTLLPGDALLLVDYNILGETCVDRPGGAPGEKALAANLAGSRSVTELGGACSVSEPDPTAVQFRAQNLSVAPAAGNVVCVEVEGDEAVELPWTGSKYSALVDLVLPETFRWRIFESADGCASAVRDISPGDALHVVASTVVNSCQEREGECGYWNVAEISDATTATPAGDGACPTDTDGDGVAGDCDACPDDGAKTEPGACGCGIADTDSDGDSVPDCNDVCEGGDDTVDTDGDGTPDDCELVCVDCAGDVGPSILESFEAWPSFFWSAVGGSSGTADPTFATDGSVGLTGAGWNIGPSFFGPTTGAGATLSVDFLWAGDADASLGIAVDATAAVGALAAVVDFESADLTLVEVDATFGIETAVAESAAAAVTPGDTCVLTLELDGNNAIATVYCEGELVAETSTPYCPTGGLPGVRVTGAYVDALTWACGG